MEEKPEQPNEEFQVPAFVGPLRWIEAEKGLATRDRKPDPGNLIYFVSEPTQAPRMSRFVSAYSQISEAEKALPLVIVPFEPHLWSKLIWPLRYAKSSFVLGNHLGTIALCGMIAEFVAVLTFDLERPNWDAGRQQKEFRRTFESMGQEERVSWLRKLGLISAEWRDDFTMLRKIRRKHLHLFSQGSETLAQDAATAFRIALSLVSQRIGQGFDNGRLVLNDKIVEYLRKRGFINATVEATGPVTAVPLEDIDEWPPPPTPPASGT